MSFKHADHACLIYSTHEELAEIIADFIDAGLRGGERCWYVASGAETPLILEALRARRVDAAAQTRKGAPVDSVGRCVSRSGWFRA
jgi:hypothetical protein